jgi:hypothetical protein
MKKVILFTLMIAICNLTFAAEILRIKKKHAGPDGKYDSVSDTSGNAGGVTVRVVRCVDPGNIGCPAGLPQMPSNENQPPYNSDVMNGLLNDAYNQIQAGVVAGTVNNGIYHVNWSDNNAADGSLDLVATVDGI